MNWKNSMTLPGLEPATFRLVSIAPQLSMLAIAPNKKQYVNYEFSLSMPVMFATPRDKNLICNLKPRNGQVSEGTRRLTDTRPSDKWPLNWSISQGHSTRCNFVFQGATARNGQVSEGTRRLTDTLPSDMWPLNWSISKVTVLGVTLCFRGLCFRTLCLQICGLWTEASRKVTVLGVTLCFRTLCPQICGLWTEASRKVTELGVTLCFRGLRLVTAKCLKEIRDWRTLGPQICGPWTEASHRVTVLGVTLCFRGLRVPFHGALPVLVQQQGERL
jgi:hypothetical protein